MQRFGEKLRFLRNNRGMTLTDMAKYLGYRTHGYISEIEVGRKSPSVGFLLAVSDLFGIAIDELVKDDVEVTLLPETLSEGTSTLGVPFAERPPTEGEIERLRLILSTYQDGTGMLARDGNATLPGWRDFERSVALAFNGVALENKDIFDVRLPNPQSRGVFYGISCKMKDSLTGVDRKGRTYLELSNALKKFWDHLNSNGIYQPNYKEYPAEVGRALIELVSQWHQDTSLDKGGNVDLSKSCYLTLSWNKKGWYQLHQFPIALPDPCSLTWTFPTTKRKGEERTGNLQGTDSKGVIFEWYGDSGGQLKYYPLVENAVWESGKFRLETIPAGQEHGILNKAITYFPVQWQSAIQTDSNP
jgi:transcriptional regulator with XRE-family HTH domain